METTQLLIFKTNIAEICPHCKVYKILNSHTEIQQWSIDTKDVDCVLRIASGTLSAAQIITLINGLGHECLELN